MVTANLITRFWKKVNKLGPIHPTLKTRCWLWTAGTFTDGYGSIRLDGRCGTIQNAHRVSWEIHNGRILKHLCVLHKCDTPPCVNPEHLFLGTHRDNAQDREQKGRGNRPYGEQHGRAKLTEIQVKEIRYLYAQGTYTHRGLAHMFEVATATMRDVITNKHWKHI